MALFLLIDKSLIVKNKQLFGNEGELKSCNVHSFTAVVSGYNCFTSILALGKRAVFDNSEVLNNNTFEISKQISEEPLELHWNSGIFGIETK